MSSQGPQRVGSFEIDVRDGEVVDRVGIEVVEAELSPRLVKRVIMACLGAFEQYIPAIMQVIYAGASPEDAVGEVER